MFKEPWDIQLNLKWFQKKNYIHIYIRGTGGGVGEKACVHERAKGQNINNKWTWIMGVSVFCSVFQLFCKFEIISKQTKKGGGRNPYWAPFAYNALYKILVTREKTKSWAPAFKEIRPALVGYVSISLSSLRAVNIE